MVYEQERRQIKAALLTGSLEDIRSEVLLDITSLEGWGFSRLARDLEAQLEQASKQQVPRQSPSRKNTGGVATCFAVSHEGLILTAHHVVQDAEHDHRIPAVHDVLPVRSFDANGGRHQLGVVPTALTDPRGHSLRLSTVGSARAPGRAGGDRCSGILVVGSARKGRSAGLQGSG